MFELHCVGFTLLLLPVSPVAWIYLGCLETVMYITLLGKKYVCVSYCMLSLHFIWISKFCQTSRTIELNISPCQPTWELGTHELQKVWRHSKTQPTQTTQHTGDGGVNAISMSSVVGLQWLMAIALHSFPYIFPLCDWTGQHMLMVYWTFGLSSHSCTDRLPMHHWQKSSHGCPSTNQHWHMYLGWNTEVFGLNINTITESKALSVH